MDMGRLSRRGASAGGTARLRKHPGAWCASELDLPAACPLPSGKPSRGSSRGHAGDEAFTQCGGQRARKNVLLRKQLTEEGLDKARTRSTGISNDDATGRTIAQHDHAGVTPDGAAFTPNPRSDPWLLVRAFRSQPPQRVLAVRHDALDPHRRHRCRDRQLHR